MARSRASLPAFVDVLVRCVMLLALVSALLGVLSPRWDSSRFWVVGHALPEVLVDVLVLAFAFALLVLRALHRELGAVLARALGVGLALACFLDAGAFVAGRMRGVLVHGTALPTSLFLALLLVTWISTGCGQRPRLRSHTRRAVWIRVMDKAIS